MNDVDPVRKAASALGANPASASNRTRHNFLIRNLPNTFGGGKERARVSVVWVAKRRRGPSQAARPSESGVSSLHFAQPTLYSGLL